jgi:hypothetical protein
MKLAFPTDYLSGPPGLVIAKPLTWVPSASSGRSVAVEMFFTNENEETVSNAFSKIGARTLVSYTTLPMGESFVVSTYVCDWQNRDVHVPSSHGDARHLVFAATDPDRTGRPIRLTVFRPPRDGDALVGQELGGYATNVQSVESSKLTLNREVVWDRLPKTGASDNETDRGGNHDNKADY